MQASDGKQRLQIVLGILISIGCLAAIFLIIDIDTVISSLKSADYGLIAVSGLLIIAYLALRAVRWRLLLNNSVPYSSVFHIQNIGYMLTQLLPLRLGDVARAIMIGNVPPVTIAQGLSTMVVERVLDLLFIVTLLPLTIAQMDSMPAQVRTAGQVTAIAALVATLILIAAANFRPKVILFTQSVLNRIPFLNTERWTRIADDLLRGLNTLTRLRSGLLLVFWSIALWIPMILAYTTIMRAVGLDVDLATGAFVMCAAALSIAAPSSPGQVGVFHAGVIAALALAGQPAAESASFAFVYHAYNFLIVLILGLIGITRTGDTIGSVVAKTRTFMSRSAQQPTS